jgi:hypothetical protein
MYFNVILNMIYYHIESGEFLNDPKHRNFSIDDQIGCISGSSDRPDYEKANIFSYLESHFSASFNSSR